jgi:hypothetical protein
MQCVRRVCVPSFIRHPIRSTSSVQSYIRSYLTADYRTSPVPAIFHFYFHFLLHSISFHIMMFERFMNCIVSFHIVCLLRYSVSFTIHLAIMHQSGDHPRRPSPVCILACIRHPILSTSSVQSYLRSYLTADSRTSPVPAIFHFFILFLLHSIS